MIIIKPLSNILFQYRASKEYFEGDANKLDYILILLVILISGSVINLSAPLLIGTTFLVLSLSLFQLARVHRLSRVAVQNIAVILSFCFALLAWKYLFLSASQSLFKYAFVYINLLIALIILLYFRSKNESIVRVFYVVLYIIMLHALLSFFAWFFVGNNLRPVPSFSNHTFLYVFYYSLSDIDLINELRTVNFLGISFFRNSGIFWEPGILQIYMNLLLFISLYVFINLRVAFLSILVIITTWSTTGFVILIIQLFYYSVSKMKKRGFIKAILFLSLFLLMFIPLKDNLMSKFQGKQAGSGFARALDTFTAINIIKNNPVFGMELDSAAYQDELERNRAVIDMEGSREARDASDTNSILNYFVFFGIPLGLYMLLCLYGQRIIMGHGGLLFVLFFVSLLSEPIGFFVFPLLFMFSKFILVKR